MRVRFALRQRTRERVTSQQCNPVLKRRLSMYRQGDVLIVPVESIPEKLDPIDRENGRVVLAHGEVTGHAHAIKAEGAALFRDPKLMAVFMRVSGDAPVALEHDDHDTIMIP